MRGLSNISPSFGLGLVASGRRNISSGTRYNSFFDITQADGKETELTDGTVYDTLGLMRKIVKNTLPQTKKISAELKGSTLQETAKNIWSFLYNNVQYKKDNPTREQLRTPVRTWKDRTSGVDCDCYSIFISSVLTNLGIAHAFRMAAYKDDFQHVYVVVPKDGKNIKDRSSYLVIDPVVDQFDYETPFSKKHDHTAMGKITALSGFGGCSTEPIIKRLNRYASTQEILQNGFVPSADLLRQNKILFVPEKNSETGETLLVATTKSGVLRVPTIITQEQAKQVVAANGGGSTAINPVAIGSNPINPVQADTKPSEIQTAVPTEEIAVNQAQASIVPSSPFAWILIAGAVGTLLLMGSDNAKNTATLAGTPEKKAPTKLKTLYL